MSENVGVRSCANGFGLGARAMGWPNDRVPRLYRAACRAMACGSGLRLTAVVALAMVLACLLMQPVAIAQSAKRGQSAEEVASLAQDNWAHWRGPEFNGLSGTAQPPIRWSESENLSWRTELPGRGHSTPIVWEDQVYLTTAVEIGEEFEPPHPERPGAHHNNPVTREVEFYVLAINRASGELAWQTKVNSQVPREGGHMSASLASASATTDGQRLYAHFGSFGTYCLDFQGNVLWQVQLGQMHSKHGHGEGSSPLVHDGKLYIVWDHEEGSFVVALNAGTGEEIWRQPREEVTCWASPILIEVDGQMQLVVNGTGRVRGYHPQSGDVIWECGGLSNNVVASPVYSDGVLVAGSSYEIRSMMAIRLDAQARGDLTGSDRVIWQRQNLTPYVPSLLLYRQQLYYLRHYQGILSRVQLESGDENPGPIRLRGFREIYASPVAADGRVYITDREGTTVVLDAEDYPRTLAVNQIDDRVNASLAVAGSQLFIRGEKALYCFETVE